MDVRAPLAFVVFLILLAVVVMWAPTAPQGSHPIDHAAPIEEDEAVQPSESVLRYSGTCDASAAVALGTGHFLVADDEHNTLLVYAIDRPGPPMQRLAWDRHLGIDPQHDEHPEADIEGAARAGDRVYWITSHGRSKSGKWRPNRHRFFALDVRKTGDEYAATPVGTPLSDLALQLVPAMERSSREVQQMLQGSLAPHDRSAKRLAPKAEGFNIEALAVMPDGKSLLIGFRNPRPVGRALLVPFLNPDDALTDGAPAEFGEPILLDLTASLEGETLNLGVRSLVYSPAGRQYYIVAGPHDDTKKLALFAWSGRPEDPPRMLEKATSAIGAIADFAPEAAMLDSANSRLQLISDDGSLLVPVDSPSECEDGEYQDGKCQMKHLRDDLRKTFRSIFVPL